MSDNEHNDNNMSDIDDFEDLSLLDDQEFDNDDEELESASEKANFSEGDTPEQDEEPGEETSLEDALSDDNELSEVARDEFEDELSEIDQEISDSTKKVDQALDNTEKKSFLSSTKGKIVALSASVAVIAGIGSTAFLVLNEEAKSQHKPTIAKPIHESSIDTQLGDAFSSKELAGIVENSLSDTGPNKPKVQKPSTTPEKPNTKLIPETVKESEVDLSNYLTKGDLKSLKESIDALAVSSSHDNSSLKNEIKSLSSKIRSINSQIEKQSLGLQMTNTKIKELRVDLETVSLVEEVLPLDNSSFTDGRERVKGYKILSATSNSEMVISTTPTTEMQVLVVGKTVRVNNEDIAITSIENSGKLVLVGDSYFIDETYEQPLTKRSTDKKDTNETPDITISGRNIDVHNTPLTEWSVNAIFDGNFLLQTPTGEFLRVKPGERIPQLGLVDGLNRHNQLVVGPYLIEFTK